jgi:HK97 family phage portal protein
VGIFSVLKSVIHKATALSNFVLGNLPLTGYNSRILKAQTKQNLLQSYNSIVYSAVQKNANVVAAVDWNVVGLDRRGNPVNQNLSPEATLLRSMNPFMEYTGAMKLTQAWLETAGCAFWWIMRNDAGIPESIWPLAPQNMTIKPNNGAMEIDFFIFQSGTFKQEIPFDEVVRFYTPHLMEPYKNSFSPLQAIWREKALWDEDILNALALMQNNSMPSGMVSPKSYEGQLGESERKAFERQWKNKFKRTGAGGIVIANEALEFTKFSFSSKDAELLARKKVTKNDIANAFDVPIALLESENINRATLEAAMFQHGFYGIAPRVTYIQNTLNEFYFKMFNSDLKIVYADPVPVDPDRKMAQEKQDADLGILTVNEIREKRKLEPVPWGFEPLSLRQAAPVVGADATKKLEEAVNSVKKIEGKKQNAYGIKDIYQEFIRYRTGKGDLARLYRMARESEVKYDTIDKWIKEISPMKTCELACCSPNKEKLLEWKAANSIPTHQPLQTIFRDIFSDQEDEVLKALSKAAKDFDGVKIKQFPDDAVEFIEAMTLQGWDEETAKRARPQIEIDTDKGVRKTVTTITASPGSPQNLPDMLGSKATQDAITQQTIKLSAETVSTTRRSLRGAVNALKKELVEGLLEEGDALPAMVKRVQAIFTNAKRHRAEAIAITESNRAFNRGTLLSAEQSNVVSAVKWILSPDPCEVCISIEADNPEVPVGAKFPNSDKLFGDVQNPPAHVNCECTLGLVLVDFN